jgi:hypothetical protein
VQVVQATDPNNLIGLPGIGVQRWIAGNQPLSYVVSFGNEADATAPAQKAVATVPLSPNADLSTLSLSNITIPNGSTSLQIPIVSSAFNPAIGIDEFTTTADLRPDQSLLLGMDVKLNRSTRTLTWTFTSLDPATGLPTLNPLAGFLPPGIDTNVFFTVAPLAIVATGAQIAEQATVVFDANAPMNTPSWVNTIDNTKPTSALNPLAAEQTSASFPVSWT